MFVFFLADLTLYECFHSFCFKPRKIICCTTYTPYLLYKGFFKQQTENERKMSPFFYVQHINRYYVHIASFTSLSEPIIVNLYTYDL